MELEELSDNVSVYFEIGFRFDRLRSAAEEIESCQAQEARVEFRFFCGPERKLLMFMQLGGLLAVRAGGMYYDDNTQDNNGS